MQELRPLAHRRKTFPASFVLALPSVKSKRGIRFWLSDYNWISHRVQEVRDPRWKMDRWELF